MKVLFRSLSIPLDWPWIKSELQIMQHEDTKGITAVDGDSFDILGCVVLDSWTPKTVTAHIVIKKPMVLRHGFLEEAFNFVFNIADREVMIGTVLSNNEKALKFDKKMGFEEKYRIKDGWDKGVDLILIEMRKENCRFLPQNGGGNNGRTGD